MSGPATIMASAVMSDPAITERRPDPARPDPADDQARPADRAGGGDGQGGGGNDGGRGGGGGSGGNDGVGDGTGPGQPARPRRSRTPVISAMAVACVTALLIAVLATTKSADDVNNLAASPLNGKTAPEITGPQLDGLRSASLSDYRGKWVLVNFFASWCVPCQQEQADLVRFQNDHSAAGDAVILGVRFDDPDVGPITSLMSRSGGHWPIVDDPNAKIDYGVTGPPESFLIDPAGAVLVHVIGKVSARALDQVLKQAKAVDGSPASPVPGSPLPASSVPPAP